MAGETNINSLLKNMTPKLNEGEYVFCAVASLAEIKPEDIIGLFREAETITVILNRHTADRLNLIYSYTAAWITLAVHSSLEAVGLTAAVSAALAENAISCNMVAAYHHDHIFVAHADAGKALKVLEQLSADVE
ncbi:ACT domain-containing protein [Mucilaginibacter ginsenosidivorans]|uniref:ACT domain-containing protein n=1 Tax=Mucilaginibacter ginsenosidivorans TaxID=398053 RepID=A0A5B8UXK4_9SPHI|nr:ACT domain-containing protein [Mucilaginibacter ginsenosidivorans]QEC63682.1 ACT domain-containing protein [Mucilaginibacter ginsenosidivorans]